ncbi:hypothetical protein B0A48_17434 [Cryoendolithus antarcticus]|uniref:RNase H type-1 domain-containing protein n=1 Tax=Cryoendolithus antarcticus TaxID=1507870 RepID=A0A1V8SD69_9PEZI|nr:hypothetical protein B0A48_17434 [Cryoendolithus antarcticus]
MGTRRAHERLERLASRYPQSNTLKLDEIAKHHLMHRIRFSLNKSKERFGTTLVQACRTETSVDRDAGRDHGQDAIQVMNPNARAKASTVESATRKVSEPFVAGIPSVRKVLVPSDPAPMPHTLQLWSDGSVVSSQYGGTAFVCLDMNGEWTAQQLPLGRQFDVMTAELVAAQAALEYAEGVLKDAQTSLVRHVILYTDCSAVKKVVLCQHETPDHLDVPARRSVAEAIMAVKARLLFRDISVHTEEVRAHAGVPGNESADVLAVGAARQSYVEASPSGFVAGRRAKKGAQKVTKGQASGGISWMDAFNG